MKIRAFWDTAHSLFEIDRRFRDVYSLHHQGDEGSHLYSLLFDDVYNLQYTVRYQTPVVNTASNFHHEFPSSDVATAPCSLFVAMKWVRWNGEEIHTGKEGGWGRRESLIGAFCARDKSIFGWRAGHRDLAGTVPIQLGGFVGVGCHE
jgi:hypothetical protein